VSKQYNQGIIWTQKQYDNYLNIIHWRSYKYHPNCDWHFKTDIISNRLIKLATVIVMTEEEEFEYFPRLKQSTRESSEEAVLILKSIKAKL
jgi:hypothetical protein